MVPVMGSWKHFAYSHASSAIIDTFQRQPYVEYVAIIQFKCSFIQENMSLIQLLKVGKCSLLSGSFIQMGFKPQQVVPENCILRILNIFHMSELLPHNQKNLVLLDRKAFIGWSPPTCEHAGSSALQDWEVTYRSFFLCLY